ncbi:MAG: methyltransferase domain-containing protein [Planctomycetaceae bacterium]
MSTSPALKRMTISIGARDVLLEVPADPDALLEHSARTSDGDPYWGILWEAASAMSACVLKLPWKPNQTALELGCGSGLVGIAAGLAGLTVCFSDYVPEAVELAIRNAALNGMPAAEGLVLDWRQSCRRQFDIVLASDVLYETGLHQPLLNLASQVMIPNGRWLIGDPGRPQARDFLNLADDQGWKVTLFDRDLRPVVMPSRSQFQLLSLTRSPISSECC